MHDEFSPLKIEIEKNVDIDTYCDKPFIVRINGTELKHLKRFAIDLDKDTMITTEKQEKKYITNVKPWKYATEYEIYPEEYIASDYDKTETTTLANENDNKQNITIELPEDSQPQIIEETFSNPLWKTIAIALLIAIIILIAGVIIF